MDFNEFYVKPVLMEAKGEYTVLSKKNGETPSVSETRKLIESLLKGAYLNLKEDKNFVRLPTGYTTRIWNSYSKSLVDKKTDNLVLFRDMVPLTKKDFITLKGKLSKNEDNNLLAIWEESFTNKVEYCIKGGIIYFIRKIMVV